MLQMNLAILMHRTGADQRLIAKPRSSEPRRLAADRGGGRQSHYLGRTTNRRSSIPRPDSRRDRHRVHAIHQRVKRFWQASLHARPRSCRHRRACGSRPRPHRKKSRQSACSSALTKSTTLPFAGGTMWWRRCAANSTIGLAFPKLEYDRKNEWESI